MGILEFNKLPQYITNWLLINSMQNPSQFILKSYTFIDVIGNDAHRFLQGQMSINADSPKTKEAFLASLCNPKGRVISLFHISKVENGFRLFLPRDIALQTRVHLKKYAVFFKVDIIIAKISSQILVISQPTEKSIKIAGTPFSMVIFDESHNTMNNNDNIIETIWYQTLAEYKIPWLTSNSCEQFLPHNLNLPALNAIDFKKGCFTGQEIIARMQYKGQLKQHLQLLKCEQTIINDCKNPPNKVFQDDKKIGEVICSINHNQQCLLIVLLKDSATLSGSFYLENNKLVLKVIE